MALARCVLQWTRIDGDGKAGWTKTYGYYVPGQKPFERLKFIGEECWGIQVRAAAAQPGRIVGCRPRRSCRMPWTCCLPPIRPPPIRSVPRLWSLLVGIQYVKDSNGEGVVTACGMGPESFNCAPVKKTAADIAQQKEACETYGGE